MNSMDFSCLAGHAISEWGKSHVEGCELALNVETVFCCKIPKKRKTYGTTLIVTAFEVKNGIKSSRWDSIGTELHNLYCKELACQTHQKP